MSELAPKREPDDIEQIMKDSTKAEFLEGLAEDLEEFDKAVVVLVKDYEDDTGRYSSKVRYLGLSTSYEALGLLELGKCDVLMESTDDSP